MSAPHARDKVVILDRDGTMVIDRGYLDDPAGLEFEPGAAAGLKAMHDHGCRLVVVTNQSGIGRGYFTMDRLEAMNVRLREMAAQAGAPLAGIYHCPHAPEDACTCRKPEQDLMRRAAADLGFDPAAAIVIGDKESDVEFGRRAGAATILIAARPPTAAATRADFVAPDLEAAARIVISGGAARGGHAC